MSKSAAVARPRHMLTGVTSPAAATHGLKDSPLQRVSEIVLIVGTVLAAAAASGSIWVVRLGVAVAIATALMSCAFAWRALNTARRTHAQAMLKATREHGEVLTEERTRNAAVVETLSLRVSDARKVIEKQWVTLARQRQRISGLQDDRIYLSGEVEYRDKIISGLRETVREREAELIALRDETEAEVHHMPRRVLAEHESILPELDAVDDMSAELESSVVDLKIIEMAMPNYEVDRQPA
jgi:urocanate hydratase